MLIRQIPRESATALAVEGDVARWGDKEHLLASILDAVRAGNWQRAGDKTAPKPEPTTRPGDPKRQTALPPDEMQRRLLALREKAKRRKATQ